MRWIALRRLGLLAFPSGPGLPPKHRVSLLIELTRLGYTIRNPEALREIGALSDWPQVVEALKSVRGGDVDYVPLFSGFPNNVPDDDEYWIQRVVGAVGNALGGFKEGRRLDNGFVVPEWLFDLSEFGADPITQMQDEGLFEKAKREQQARRRGRHVEWRRLEIITTEQLEPRLRAFLHQNLYARSSIKEVLHEDLRDLLSHLGYADVDSERVSRKETMALVLDAAWRTDDIDTVRRHAKTPTDLLRMFASLTGTDLSLAKPVRFPRMRRPQRKWLLEILEGSPALAEDLLRYRGLWLQVGRYLHPGEHAARFPKTAAAFDALRDGRIRSFASQTESLLAENEAKRLLSLLADRPGVLGRKLHELLRRLPESSDATLAQFAAASSGIALKNLLVLSRHFATINEAEMRVVVNKRGTIRVLDNNARGALDERQLGALRTIIDEAIHEQLAARESWAGQSAWLDPVLDLLTVPLQQRAASDGMLGFARGSHLPVEFDRVIRFFVYWKQSQYRTDLDLSALELDADWNYVGHVSYTQLSDAGIVHSGDIQSAPRGAAEFIDLTLSSVKPGVRYIVAQVHRYAGESFADNARCHAGWMFRQDVDAHMRTFDIKTVAHKFNLTGHTSFCVPLIVDLEARRIILTDLYMGSGTLASHVEGSHLSIARACREVARFTETRPTLGDLARRHVAARGATLTEDQESADLRFGIDADCGFDVSRPELVLSQLL